MNLSEPEKVAVLLIALGRERAEKILNQLGPDDLVTIIDAMKNVKDFTAEVRRAVLEEVNEILLDPGTASETGDGPFKRREILGRIQPLLPNRIEAEGINWDAAGFDFGDPWPRRPPPPDDEP